MGRCCRRRRRRRCCWVCVCVCVHVQTCARHGSNGRAQIILIIRLPTRMPSGHSQTSHTVALRRRGRHRGRAKGLPGRALQGLQARARRHLLFYRGRQYTVNTLIKLTEHHTGTDNKETKQMMHIQCSLIGARAVICRPCKPLSS